MILVTANTNNSENRPAQTSTPVSSCVFHSKSGQCLAIAAKHKVNNDVGGIAPNLHGEMASRCKVHKRDCHVPTSCLSMPAETIQENAVSRAGDHIQC